MKKLFKRLVCLVSFVLLTAAGARADTSVVMVNIDESARPRISRLIHEGRLLKVKLQHGRNSVVGTVKSWDEGRRFAVLVIENNTLHRFTCGRVLMTTDGTKNLTLGKIAAIATIATKPIVSTEVVSPSGSHFEPSDFGSQESDAGINETSDFAPSFAEDDMDFASPAVPPIDGRLKVQIKTKYGAVVAEGETPQDLGDLGKALNGLGVTHRRFSI